MKKCENLTVIKRMIITTIMGGITIVDVFVCSLLATLTKG
jgi:hypothetical protein